MSIEQGIAGAKYASQVNEANDSIKAYLSHKRHSTYIDMNAAIYKHATDQPDSSLFETDYIQTKPAMTGGKRYCSRS
jgi:hypothetical protein